MFEAEILSLIVAVGHCFHSIWNVCSYVAKKTHEEFIKLTGSDVNF